jgi:hypothetical protein
MKNNSTKKIHKQNINMVRSPPKQKFISEYLTKTLSRNKHKGNQINLYLILLSKEEEKEKGKKNLIKI